MDTDALIARLQAELSTLPAEDLVGIPSIELVIDGKAYQLSMSKGFEPCRVVTDPKTLEKIVSCKTTPQAAFEGKEIKLSGDGRGGLLFSRLLASISLQ